MSPDWKTVFFLRSSCTAKSAAGHRERGGPKKRFKESLKKSLTTCNIDHRQWSVLDTDRVVWRHTIHQPAAKFESDRRNSLKDKTEEKGPGYHHHHTLPPRSLLEDLSLPHRSGPPPPCLQSRTAWTNFINLCSRSQAMVQGKRKYSKFKLFYTF